jgi:parallel beta-helix repeat protein
MKQVGFLLVIGVVASVGVATATVRHVPSEYLTIQAGVDAAVDGDTVLVADGTYIGDGNRDIDFIGKPILVASENGPEVTIIDCEASYSDQHWGFYFHSGEDSNSVVQGFTITNAYTLYGGGIYCDSSSSPTITGNLITLNTGYLRGGGIYCLNASPIIVDNDIIDNNVFFYGGGVYCDTSSPVIVNNNITNNLAANSGGGVYCWHSSPTIEGNTLLENMAYSNGGGIYCGDFSSPAITDNAIHGNSGYGGGSGGGIYCYKYSSPAITGNTILGNTAAQGAGICCYTSASPIVERNVIAQNNADSWGGGIYCEGECEPFFDGNTITGNWGSSRGGGLFCYKSSPTFINCIMWGDSADTGPEIHVVDTLSVVTITYSDIAGGWEGEGNIDADPLFVTGPLGDYYLSQIAAGQEEDSPCVDAGDPSSSVPEGTTRTDEVEDTWPVDMGYHYPLGEPIEKDAGVVSIDAPPDLVLPYVEYQVQATVANYGLNEETFDVVCTIDGYSDTQTVTLGPESSVQITFLPWTSGGAGETYLQTVYTALAGDVNPANDTLSQTILVETTDVGVVTIDAPPETVDPNTSYVPQATVENFGDYEETFSVTCTIDGYSDVISVTLSPGASTQVSFASWTSGGSGETYLQTVYTELAGDVNPDNDSLSRTIVVAGPGVTVILTPDATTVERGGTLGYTVEVTNATAEDQTFEYWSDVYLWTGDPYKKNPVFGPMTVTIRAGKTKSGHLSHKVPKSAPLRTYTLCGRIGWHPDDIWDEDCFQFTVVDRASPKIFHFSLDNPIAICYKCKCED